MRFGLPFWGFLMDRIDHRIAVSEHGGGLGEALAPAPGLRGDPERRPDPARRRPGQPRELDRLHRPPRPAQGDARAAEGVARDPPAHRRAAAARRRRSARGAAPARAAPDPARRHRHPRLPAAGGADRGAAAREGARRPVDRQGELRDGADARVRVRGAGRRVGHPGVRGGDDRGHRRARPAGRRPRARRRARRAARGRAAARGARRRARAGSRSSATRGTRSPSGSSRSTRTWPREAVLGILRSPWIRVRWHRWSPSSAGSARSSGGTARTGARSTTRSPSVEWEWVAAAIGLNLLSVVARAFAWETVINAAMPPPHPGFRARLLRVLRRAARRTRCCPGGSASSRASPCSRRKIEPQQPGPWPTLVGTVFAHRVFDLVPVAAARRLGALRPRRSRTGRSRASWILLAIGVVLFLFALATRPRTTTRRGSTAWARVQAGRDDGAATASASCASPWPAFVAIVGQCVGWMCQLFAVWTAMEAFDIHDGLPAAGLVLVLMNVATIIPLWPGNVGLVQVAVATPLVAVRRRLRDTGSRSGSGSRRSRRRSGSASGSSSSRARGSRSRGCARCRARSPPTTRRPPSSRSPRRRPSVSPSALACPASLKGCLSAAVGRGTR